jgi:hypothetical protein
MTIAVSQENYEIELTSSLEFGKTKQPKKELLSACNALVLSMAAFSLRVLVSLEGNQPNVDEAYMNTNSQDEPV